MTGLNYQSMNADEISSLLHGKLISEKWKCKIALADAASLFVALAFISSKGVNDRDALRTAAYREFLSEKEKNFPQAWNCLNMLCGGVKGTSLKLRVLKGGSYKIKQYYLENGNLRDIRGASVLLTHVEEELIPGIIANDFIPECIVYCGGGNIFAILPELCDSELPLRLENEAQKLLISAGIAYNLSEPMSAADLFGENYATKMSSVENSLNERKKLIISNKINAETEFTDGGFAISSDGGNINIKFNAAKHQPCTCSACRKRRAFYSLGGSELCASCLHKRAVGEATKRTKYLTEYKKYTGSEAVVIDTLSDISKEYIAVVYGDGNNMGGVIRTLNKITDMMAFSRDVKTIANKAVFESMKAVGISAFEVVGLGGDDVFVIVPGEKAVRFAASLIARYNSQFKCKYDDDSTMSVGIAIGKTKMPVNVLLEVAESRLKEAKTLAKHNKVKTCDDGSLAFSIMDTFEGESGKAEKKILDTLQPYSLTTADSVIRLVESFKSSKPAKSRLRNILTAFENSETCDEAQLFLRYMNAKSKEAERVKLPEIKPYTLDGGYYIKDDKRYYIWKDLIDLLSFCD